MCHVTYGESYLRLNIIADPVSHQQLTKTVSEFKLFLEQWHFSYRQKHSRDFPQLHHLLDAHFGINSSFMRTNKTTSKSTRFTKKRTDGLGRPSTRLDIKNSSLSSTQEMPESCLEKQLRKAIQNFRENNFFKAICCYAKVSDPKNQLPKFVRQFLVNLGSIGNLKQTFTLNCWFKLGHLVYFLSVLEIRDFFQFIVTSVLLTKSFLQACEELDSKPLSQQLKEAEPEVYAALTDINLCAAVCYVRMQ